MNKRIILVGPSAGGKNYIREKFREKGYEIDVSYTTRSPREGEENGRDYIFITNKGFDMMVEANGFYEWVEYNGNCYGTGAYEFKNCDVFIMETDGISKLKPEDREKSLIIYVNTPLNIRIERMKERRWTMEKIMERIQVDYNKFSDFSDYDFEISSEIQHV